jgi:hypothetical protein
MDARIKSGHDECVCVHTNIISKKQHRSPTQVRDLAARFRASFAGTSAPEIQRAQGMPGA